MLFSLRAYMFSYLIRIQVKNMKILVILGHPDSGSFNHAIASTVCKTAILNRHEVMYHDLDAEGFDPILTRNEIPETGLVPEHIRQHCDELQAADGIVIIHPNWWGQPPAILKGWVDRVVRPGVAYRFDEGDKGEGIPVGLLKAESALILNTSNTPDHREISVFGDPLALLWKQCIFDLCGVKSIHRRMFNVVITSTFEQRTEWLNETKQLVSDIFPEKP